HGPNSAIQTGCRTMDLQRAVSKVLTDCLSRGAHPKIEISARQCVCLAGVFRKALPPPRPHKEQTLAILRNAEVEGVKDLVILLDLVALRLELHDDLGEKLLVFADGQAAHVFEDEIFRLKFEDHADEVVH